VQLLVWQSIINKNPSLVVMFSEAMLAEYYKKFTSPAEKKLQRHCCAVYPNTFAEEMCEAYSDRSL